MQYKIEKVSDDVFEGLHPNGIYEGHTVIGSVITELIIGERFEIWGTGNFLSTSPITEIVSMTTGETIFKTLNSTYKLTSYE